MTIKTLRNYFPRLGRIGMGYMTDVKADGTKAKAPFPTKSRGFTFHTDERDRAEEIARVFGGKVEEAVSRDEEGGSWRVVTEATELECFALTADESSWDCHLEMWGAGGILRRCDGEVASMAVSKGPDGKDAVLRNVPCLCEQEGLPQEARCDATSRLNIVIPALKDVPGIGVWQVQSRGVGTWRAIDGTMMVLEKLGKVARVPLLLKAEYKTVRGGDGRPRDVPVMRLDSKMSMAEAMRMEANLLEKPPGGVIAMLPPPPDREQPTIGQRREEDPGQRYRADGAEGKRYVAPPEPAVPEPDATPKAAGEGRAEEPDENLPDLDRVITHDEQIALLTLVKSLGVDASRAKAEMIALAHVEHSSKLTVRQKEALELRLRNLATKGIWVRPRGDMA